MDKTQRRRSQSSDDADDSSDSDFFASTQRPLATSTSQRTGRSGYVRRSRSPFSRVPGSTCPTLAEAMANESAFNPYHAKKVNESTTGCSSPGTARSKRPCTNTTADLNVEKPKVCEDETCKDIISRQKEQLAELRAELHKQKRMNEYLEAQFQKYERKYRAVKMDLVVCRGKRYSQQ